MIRPPASVTEPSTKLSVVVRSSGPGSAIMRRTRISFLCAAVLAALPVRAEAGGLGSVVGAVASAPRAILGGLLGGGRASHHRRHHARHATPERPVARAAPERSVVRAAPAIPAEPKSADHRTAAFWASAYHDSFGYVLPPAAYAAFLPRGGGGHEGYARRPGCAARIDVAAAAGIAPGGHHGSGSAQEFLRLAQ